MKLALKLHLTKTNKVLKLARDIHLVLYLIVGEIAVRHNKAIFILFICNFGIFFHNFITILLTVRKTLTRILLCRTQNMNISHQQGQKRHMSINKYLFPFIITINLVVKIRIHLKWTSWANNSTADIVERIMTLH